MKTSPTRNPTPTDRATLSETNRPNDRKHAAAERWLHRPRQTPAPSGATRWFG